MDKIQLTALSSLHNFTPLPATVALKPAKTIQIAEVSVTEIKPVKPPKLQKTSVDDLINSLQGWASAWSQKDFKGYITSYSRGYKGNKVSHQAWVNYRRSRVLKPGTIQVTLSNFQIKSQSNTQAIIDFHQSFKSATYKDKVVKRIHLTKIKNSWKITREVTIAVL